ncbi:RNA polymerase principal sigma factor HrdA [Phycisphaerae bacterium RAS1]|nr:RNA polymerase principal sigma factor HrdA [Phycisphaerae bacterium RAS1]
MQAYQSLLLEDLATQLLRGPKRLRLRQLFNIEFVLTLLEPGKSFPYDFVRHALTGFRAPGAPSDTSDAHLIELDDLIADLTALAEDLSEDAGIRVDEWAGPVFSVAELAERFDVSTKTIFRWRRRGLIGWKFRFADRRTRLLFTDRSIRRFVAHNADLIQRGSSFSQLTRDEREVIIARAKALVELGQKTANAVARTIAAETGRAVETIRLLLKGYDDAHPAAGIFNRSTLTVAADDVRLSVWEAYLDGASVEALAERFSRPIAWIYQTITQMKARELKSRPIEFMPSDEFEDAFLEDEILNGPAVRQPNAPLETNRRIPRDLPPYLQQLFRIPLLTPEGEAALFRKMNFLRFRAEKLREALDPDASTPADLDAIDALLAQAADVKKQITQANLRLVVSTAKKHLSSVHDFFELISDGNVSLMRAVDKFDYSRGNKFSTYAWWAINKNFARTIPEQRHHQDRYRTGQEELFDSVALPSEPEAEDDQLAALRRKVEDMLACLDERAREILRQRFGLEDHGQPQTLEQIGKRLGVSKERVRQIEARAMEKLREDFGADLSKLLGPE